MESEALKGILLVAHLVLKFAAHRSQGAFIEVMSHLDEDALQGLPYHIRNLLPLSDEITIVEQRDFVQQLNEQEFSGFLKTGRNKFYSVIRAIYTISETGSFSLSLWESLVFDHPSLAFYLWVEGGYARSQIPQLQSTEATEILVLDCIKRKDTLIDFPEAWGRLIELAKKHESDLRQCFIFVANEYDDTSDYVRSHNIHPFNIDIIKEAELLPVIVSVMLKTQKRARTIVEPFKQLEQIRVLFSSYAINMRGANFIIGNNEMPNRVRAAALLVKLLLSDDSGELKYSQEEIVRFYNTHIGEWYLRSLVVTLTLTSSEFSSAAQWIVGNLLDLSRNNYNDRKILHELLAVWREQSHGVVQSADVLGKWLLGN